MKKKKYLILIIICCLFFSMIYFHFGQKNKSFDNENIYNENFFFKEFDEKNITYNEKDNLIVKNQLIIESDNSSKNDIEELIAKYNGEIVGYIAITHTYQIEFDDSINLNDTIEELENNEHIENIYYNYVFSTTQTSIEYPNDKLWENDWSETADGDNWGLEAINIPETWNYLADKELNEVNIGVFECNGFQENHEDLKNNVNSTLGNYNQTDKAHGTNVSGIIAAEYNNKKGISGITMNKGKIDYFSYMGAKNPNHVDMMTYKIGLTYLITTAKEKNNQTAIVNTSLGYEHLLAYASFGSGTAENEIKEINEHIETFLKTLLDKGYEFLIVKAAGNSNENQYLKVNIDKNDKNTKYGYVPYIKNHKSKDYKKYSYLYPSGENELTKRIVQGNCDAQYDIFSGIEDEEIKERIIVVGATENEGNNQFKLSEWYSVCGSRVDILAPGTYVGTLTEKNCYITVEDKSYGTSLSAPYVSGIAGLVLTIDKSIPGDELKEVLVQSGTGEYKATVTKNDGTVDECNYSMIDALEAIKLVEEKSEPKKAISVKFTLQTANENEGVLENAIISGIDNNNNIIWTYNTKSYECTELDRISEIGIKNDIYYFIEDGAVKALKVSDGSILWENKDFGGALGGYTFDEDGILYICGFYGPDLFIVNKSGKTIHRISEFDSQYFWPYKINYNNGKLHIVFDNSPSGNEATCIVDLKDYTYYFEENSYLSDEQLEKIKKELGVPNDLSVSIEQDGPYYWEAGELYYLQISIIHNGKKIAGAHVDSSNGELIKEIYTYME